MCTSGWVKEARVPDSDVVLFPQKHPCLTTVCAAHVHSGFLCLDDRKRDDVKLSTRAVASTFKSRMSTRAVACTVKRNKIRSFSNVTVSLIVDVKVEKQRSARGSAELQGSGAPGAPTTFNSFGSPLQATSSFSPSSRNQIVSL